MVTKVRGHEYEGELAKGKGHQRGSLALRTPGQENKQSYNKGLL